MLGTLFLYLYHTNSMCDSEKTFFIKATEDSPCAAQPCLTISEFVNNITNNIKVMHAEWFCNLARQETIHLNSQWNFSSNEKYSTKGRNNTIICDKLGAGFAFSNVSIVLLTSLTFIGCGNDSWFYVVLQLFLVNISISVCTFLHSKGSAIEAAHTNITR